MDGKTKAIVSHLFLIGWIIAMVLNTNDKDEFASFYIRQVLGIMLISLIPYVGWIIGLVLWVLSLVGSIQNEKNESPVVGKYFQDWFKTL